MCSKHKGHYHKIKSSTVVRRDFYVVIISTSGLDVSLCTETSEQCAKISTHLMKVVDRNRITTTITLIYGKGGSFQVLLLERCCEGCNPVKEERSLILLNFYSALLFILLHISSGRPPFYIKFLKLRMKWTMEIYTS